MISFPFDSKNTGSESNPVWDRAITSEMERQFNKLIYTNGVFSTPANSLMVKATSGMNIQVCPGGCHIEGARAYESNYRMIALQASNNLPRIDRIVLRFDTAENRRDIDIYVKTGTPSTRPAAPELVRQPNFYELGIADIYIPGNAVEITASNISDIRMNPEVCGLVIPAIPIDNQSAELWEQIKGSIETVNNALKGTIAGELNSKIEKNEKAILKNVDTISKVESKVNEESRKIKENSEKINKIREYPKLVYSGNAQMNGSEQKTFDADDLKNAPVGLQLVFCPYKNGSPLNRNFQSFTVSKKLIEDNDGAGHEFWMNDGDGWIERYLNISKNSVKGHSTNTKGNWVLRYILIV